MAEWFSNGHIAWLVAAILVLESGLLILIRNKVGGLGRWDDFLAGQAAGLGLVLALRAALVGAPWISIAGWLLLAFAAHVTQVVIRFKSATLDARSRRHAISAR